MAGYLITGSPGVGKSSVIEELERRGYAAYNTDDHKELTWFDDIKTGKPLSDRPPTPIDFERFTWNWRLPALKKLMNSADIVFLGGVTSNTFDNLHLFDVVFVLHTSVKTLKHRLETRKTNDFGKHPDEQKGVLDKHKGSDEIWKKHGAVIIDADQPLSAVADSILDYLHLEKHKD